MHEKGGMMTQLSIMKYRQQPLVQNADIFSALTFPSQTISSEYPAVETAPQTIMKSHQTQIQLLSENRAKTGTHQRRQWYPKTPQACLSSLTPLLSALNVERAKKWLPSSSSTAIPKGMEILDNSS